MQDPLESDSFEEPQDDAPAGAAPPAENQTVVDVPVNDKSLATEERPKEKLSAI